VSRVGDRNGETFVSPGEQRERIEAACQRDGLALVEVVDELDVSGGASLDRRPGLRRALELVEADAAEVVVVAYFDRLFRSFVVQAQVVERVEQAGGSILALDVGEVRADTASRWLSSGMLGLVAEYHRRATAERTEEAKRRAVERGVAPFPNLPPGYRRGEGAVVEVDPALAPVVVEAFERRAGGATIRDVRAFLAEHGIERSFHGVQAMLRSPLYVGELRFGETVREDDALAIVPRNVWTTVQRVRVPRGRRPKSERLLARLGVLRCASCGARMVVGSSRPNPQGEPYAMYRCPPVGDCKRRVTISAERVEGAVERAVRKILDGASGSASESLGAELEEAEQDVERREAELDAAVRAFAGLDDVEAARERLLELREARDAARDRVAELRAASAPASTIEASEDWELLSLHERRALVRAVLDSVLVAPGRGPDRVTILSPVGEHATSRAV
jgi:site-specific DNA recombinase